MKQLFQIFILSFFCIKLPAQQVYWQKDISTQSQDFLTGVINTLDGQLLVTGSVIVNTELGNTNPIETFGKNNGYDYHIVKLTQEGELVFDKTFSGNNNDFLNSAIATQEGGFILSGTTFSSKRNDKKENGFGGSDIWVIKTNENGEEEWQKTIGTTNNEEARAVIQNSDLGYFIAGNIIDTEQGFGSKDVWIIKLDSKGHTKKEIIIGGADIDEVEKMIPTNDGGALIGVYTRSGKHLNTSQITSKLITKNDNSKLNNKQEKNIENTIENKSKPNTQYVSKDCEGYGEGDYWVIKLDKDGNVEWQKNIGGNENDHLKTLVNTTTGFVIAGESKSNNTGNKSTNTHNGNEIWLVALNFKGDIQWQKSYAMGNYDKVMSLNRISGNKNNTKGYLVGGYSQSEERIQKNEETFWMIYLNDEGNEIWRKYIDGKSKNKEERLVGTLMLNDGSYILAGTSSQQLGRENWKILKLKDQQIQELIEKQNIKIYPNPVGEYCYVEIDFEFKDAEIILYDMSGRQLQNIKTKNRITKINTTTLVQGSYLLVAKTETEIANAKIIKK